MTEIDAASSRVTEEMIAAACAEHTKTPGCNPVGPIMRRCLEAALATDDARRAGVVGAELRERMRRDLAAALQSGGDVYDAAIDAVLRLLPSAPLPAQVTREMVEAAYCHRVGSQQTNREWLRGALIAAIAAAPPAGSPQAQDVARLVEAVREIGDMHLPDQPAAMEGISAFDYAVQHIRKMRHVAQRAIQVYETAIVELSGASSPAPPSPPQPGEAAAAGGVAIDGWSSGGIAALQATLAGLEGRIGALERGRDGVREAARVAGKLAGVGDTNRAVTALAQAVGGAG